VEKELKEGLGVMTVAMAQVLIFAGSILGFIGLLYVLVMGGASLDETSEKLTYTMLGVLGTIVTQMSGYFYSRQRPETPVPGETTVTTSPATTTVTTASAPATSTVITKETEIETPQNP
jgi:hypothetical protein